MASIDAFLDEISGPDDSPRKSTVDDFLSDIEGGKNKPTPEPKRRPALGGRTRGDVDLSRAVGVGETALNMGTSMVGSVAGGLAGIATPVTNALGITDISPADNVAAIRDRLTYQPRTPAGQQSLETFGAFMGHPANPASWLGRAGEFAGESAEAAGWGPLASTVMQTAPDALASTLGVPGVARNALRQFTPRDAPNAPIRGMEGAFSRESIGAAAASPDLQAVSPDIRAVVERMAAEGPLDRAVLTRHVEADLLPVKVRLTKGQATQDPTQISLEQNARGKNPELARIFHEQNQQLIDNLDEMRAASAPNAVALDPVQSGQALIDAYKAFDEPVRADITAKYKQLEAANGGQFPVNGADFVAAADAALAKKMKGRYVPAQVAGDLADLREGGPMTFEGFENLRTNLAAEARKADRSGDGNAAAAVNIVREALESLPMTGEAAKIKPLADAARAAAKARFDKLRSDPAYRAAVEDGVPSGELSPLADEFVTKYVVKGKAANLRTMRENLSADPMAQETIAAGALNYLKSKSGVNLYTNEGNFSQAGYNRALSELMPKLEYLLDPKTAEQVQALGNVARYTQAQPRGAFVNTSNTYTAAVRDHVANAIEGVMNVAAHGVPVGTMARKKLQQRKDRKFVEEATAPGAGIARKNVVEEE